MHRETTEKNEASYSVRVLHRRDKDDQLVGVVELVENGTRHAFISRDELWAILCMSATNPPAKNNASDIERG